MKKKQITKLFAVMAMAASPAVAGTAPDPWAVSASVVPLDHAAASEAMAALINIGFAAIGHPREVEIGPAAPVPMMARPRAMPSGAPACGNVASRAPRPVECTPASPQIITAGSPAAPVATPTGGAK